MTRKLIRRLPDYDKRMFKRAVKYLKYYNRELYLKEGVRTHKSKGTFCLDAGVNVDNFKCEDILCDDCIFNTKSRLRKYLKELE